MTAIDCKKGHFVLSKSQLSAFLNKVASKAMSALGFSKQKAKHVLGNPDAVTTDSNLPFHAEHNTNEIPKVKPRHLGILRRLFAFAFLLGAAYSAQAGTFYCSSYGGVIDGNDPSTFAYISTTNNTLGIDTNCTIINWPQNNGIGGFPITNINFYFPGGADYYIVFDNVYYPGNMSCNSPTNSNFWIYWAPGSFNKISSNCQDFMVPVDIVVKTNPVAQTTATIGVPFTYTITAPKLGMWDVNTNTFKTVAQSDTAELRSLVLVDDLTLSGAAITYVTNKAYLVNVSTGTRTPLNSGNPLTLGASATWLSEHPGVLSDATKHLVFSYENNPDLASVPPGYRVDIDLTVVLDNDTTTNYPTRQFTNTAEMWFDKVISFTRDDGTTGYTPMTGLHAWPSTTLPMTIVAPDFVVNKSTTSTAVNPSNIITYTIDAQNTGGWEAWNVKLEDIIPQNTVPPLSPAKGMCATDPTTFGTGLSARILDAGGALIRTLNGGGADYTLAWSTTGPNACKIILTLTDSAGAIAPNQHLDVTYQTQIDPAFVGGGSGSLVNVAGTTHWFNANSTLGTRKEFLGGDTGVLTDGTPSVSDFQDNASVTVAVSGYYFEKTVSNLVTGDDPATSALPGDKLRYRIHLFNVNQTISTISIADPLDATKFVLPLNPADIVTCSVVGPVAVTVTPVCSFDSGTNELRVSGSGGNPLDLPQGDDLVIEFDVTLQAGLGNGVIVSNQAKLTASGITTVTPVPLFYPSDDPNVGGVSDPAVLGDEQPTNITIVATGPLSKANPTQTSVPIGQQFSYQITVPATTVAMPLYDVHVLDTLPPNLRLVSASAVVGTTTLSLTDTDGGADNNLDLVEQATGLDIPANKQAIVTVTVAVRNDALNQSGSTFQNTAAYTYSRSNGGTQTSSTGTEDTTTAMTVVEPVLTASKTVSFVAPASKVIGTDPATVGDVLQYVVTIQNTGNSEAFDVNVVDTLPPELELYTGFTPTATINGSAVSGFVATPAGAPAGPLYWGQGNNDGSLDIPVGQTLVLTYQVTVNSATAPSLINSVTVDWTSLDGETNPEERTGAGCPTTTAPDDYCVGPVSATPITTQDNTSITKAWVFDTYGETPPSTADPIVRVGDTVTYDLTLNLQEYTTRSVVVEDTLPQGMALESFTIDPGATTFNYTMVAQPSVPSAPGATLTWNFGDIYNVPSNNGTPLDKLVIRYVAKVVTADPPAGIGAATSISLDNSAKLTYTGGDPALYPARLTATERVEARQPQMRTITKVDLGTGRVGTGTSADPYQVNIATDVMNFQLSSCNDGLAPAYGVVITDQLASQLDETDLLTTPPVVKIGATTLSAGSDYLYTAPARGGLLSIALQDSAPVNPGECVTVDYNLGFHNDLTTQTTWNNQAQLPEYRSLPLSQSGRIYTSTATSSVWMTNAVTIYPLSKSLKSPAEVTIGEAVTYEIRVPANPMNVALDNVQVTDTLHNALLFENATATLDGSAWAITNSQTGQVLTLGLGTIPAGKQVIITLTTRVANNSSANAGTSFANSASYSYTGMPVGTNTSGSSTQLTIVEPLVTVAKGASTTTPAVGELVTYTVNLTASGGGAGDIYSNAFDLTVEDSLSLGLLYEPGTATLNGVALADPATNGGDGVTTAQKLTWSPAGVNIDVAEGATATITYKVRVLNSVAPGQTLTNSVVGRWTGLDGDQSAVNERTGSGTPIENDYFTTPYSVTLTIGDNTGLTKAVFADSYAENPPSTIDPIVRVGDTVTYDLTLSLQEGTTQNVVLEDLLPAGMALESFTIIPASGAGTFSYTPVSTPSAGATGTLRWELGNVTNTPSNDNTPTDPLVVRYVAKVVTDPTGVGLATSILLDNQATLTYTGGTPATANERVEVRQPLMRAITKADLGSGRTGTGTSADPYQINIASDVMNFRLSSCNDGLAPAYGVQITDQLASQLDETSLSAPVVSVGGTVLSTADYVYTPPAGRAGTLGFLLNAPVNPGQCVTVDYNIGFHTDITTQTSWSNQAQLTQYASLPLNGRVYTDSTTAQVWMTNLVTVQPLSKALTSTSEATIGQLVTYQIKVPAIPMNVAIDAVSVTDTLDAALKYESATATLNGSPLAISTSQTGQALTFGLGTIPAGQQVVITLTTRVDNNAQANAGTSITNTADYSYTGKPSTPVTAATSGAVKIVEPLVTVTKTASSTVPAAGDLITYTLTFTAAGGATGDNFSNAFDLTIEDSLSLGLTYVAGSATVNGATLANPTTTGDGVTTPQNLSWNPANGINIDIAEGTTATVTYQVRVLNSVSPGQTLTNSVVGRWTGLDGDQSAIERTGSGTPVENDYFTQPASVSMTTALAVSLTKSVINVTSGQNPGANAKPGDTLRYTLVLANQSLIAVSGASLVDELAAQFASLNVGSISVTPTGGDNFSSATGGANGAGIVDIRNLTLAAKGNAGDTVTVVFEAILDPVITNGTTVLNQAQLTGTNLAPAASNQTSTLISSAPRFQVYKTSQDVTGDANVLLPGETLRYTITVKNIGTENATGVTLSDVIPNFTSYKAGTTRLNGVLVADPSAGVSALQNGLLINAPENTTAGAMRADSSATTANVATITFDVAVNTNVLSGTIISNQGYVNGSGAGSGPFAATPSDDPNTTALNDPTRDIVGYVPLLDATKTVSLQTDVNSNGAVDPGDVLRYTISVNNSGTVPATGVVLTDAVPANTTYVADSVTLNGASVGTPDGGTSPLIAGIPVNSTGSVSGTIAAASSAIVTFDVTVNGAVAAGTVISNQGYVASNEVPTEPTDMDGDDSNGDQPTTIVVGNTQQLSIVKSVIDINGGVVEPGDTLEYVVTVTNTGATAATNVVISDDLNPLAGQVSFVAGSATLNGSATGVSYAGAVLTADYSTNYGSLPVGAAAALRFRVVLASTLASGATVTNTGVVSWNSPAVTASASAAVTISGIPGTAMLNGHVWHDANFSNLYDSGEINLAGWTVTLYRNSVQLGSTTTDANGLYGFAGLAPTAGSDQYSITFTSPGAGSNTAKLGLADSAFTNGLQSISAITAASGSNVQNLNLPIDPNGVVYDALRRTPIAGARLTMTPAGSIAALPGNCFDDPAQQNQVTLASGFYKFDLNFSDPACPAGGEYIIRVTPPATGYEPGVSRLIPPVTSDTTGTYSVAGCSADAVGSPAGYCEAQSSAYAPAASIPAGAGTSHYLHLTLSTPVPGSSQLFNNHIPLDPTMQSMLTITKTAALVNVSRGQLVPYTITVNNTLGADLTQMSIVDTFPAGFKYVAGSARVNGVAVEPAKNNLQLSWNNLQITNGTPLTIKLLFIVGSGVGEGEYVNRAQVVSMVTGSASGEATATVRVIPDPTFDCTDIIGKVFDDANRNGYQDKGEKGLPGVRLATARGLLVTTDKFGRYHITCAATPDENRGSNFIIKVDERTLPTGYRITTENPLVLRVTRGKMMKFNFGATIHKVVRLDMSNGVFEPGKTELRIQWKSRMGLLMEQLKKGPSVLRVAYMAEVEDEGLVQARLDAVKQEIAQRWAEQQGGYELEIETEIFWRTGAPPDRSMVK